MTTKAEIIATGSGYKTLMRCPRERWWGYEAPNGTSVRGWQRDRLAIAPTTGTYCHAVVQGLLTGGSASDVICAVLNDYRREVAIRTLDVEVADSGQWAIDEQAALIEAFG